MSKQRTQAARAATGASASTPAPGPDGAANGGTNPPNGEGEGDKDDGLAELRAPEGATSCSLAGVEYTVTEAGTVRVPPEYVDHLAQFGFTNVVDEA